MSDAALVTPDGHMALLMQQTAVASAAQQGVIPMVHCEDLQASLCRTVTPEETTQLTEDTVDWVVDTLSRAGVACLKNAVPAATVQRAHQQFAENWQALYTGLIQPYEERYGCVGTCEFREVVSRGPGRYDCTHGLDKGELGGTHYARSALVEQLMTAALGDDSHQFGTGCVVARPGAEDQAKHADSSHLFDPKQMWAPAHHYTVFQPLVDVTPETGCTRFCLGSHITNSAGWSGPAPPADDRYVSLFVPAGSIVIFDCRIYHQGSANHSFHDRPIYYSMWGKTWFSEKNNGFGYFGTRSIVDEARQSAFWILSCSVLTLGFILFRVGIGPDS